MAGYLVALAVIKLLILEPGQAVNPAESERFAFTVLVPCTSAAFYLLAVFGFGLAGDVAGRESLFPARMFTLPVSTSALAGWPMLYGMAAMATLWLATALFGLRPSGVDLPLLWPAVFAAVFVGWAQALLWLPYGLRGMRVMAAVVWLATVETSVVLAFHFQASDQFMLTLLAPQLPLAYLTARYAVAMARRGHVPDWRLSFARRGRVLARPRRRAAFASAAHAQSWLEWRQHGGSLPALVAMLLPFELALLFVLGDTPALVWEVLFGVLLTPPFLAAFAAHDFYGLTPFIATRPVSNDALLSAKLKATLRSTLAAWLLVLVAIPGALAWSGTGSVAIKTLREISVHIGTSRTIVVLLLVIVGLMAATWKQLVQSLYIGLSGREWLIKAMMFAMLLLLVILVPLGDWFLGSSEAKAALWDALPWLVALLVLLKLSAAAWIAVRLYHTRLLSDRVLVLGAAAWVLVVLSIYGILAWLLSAPHMPRYFLTLLAILAVPLARLSAAPLALAWNRHQ